MTLSTAVAANPDKSAAGAGCRAEGTSVRRVARWLWQPAEGSGRSGAAVTEPPQK
jgi:hypothetical protein